MSWRFAMAVAALALITAQGPLLAKPLVCPNTPAAANAISPEDLKTIAALGSGVGAAMIDRIVVTMRDRGMAAGNIVDTLVSAYCPVVAAEASLDDRQKTKAVRSFASQAARAVYAPAEANEIILDVPLPPAIANAVNDKAKAARMSPQEWAAKAIVNDINAGR